MSMRKRLLAVLCTLAMLCAALPVGLVSVSAENAEDFDYTVLDDGTVEITGYTGEGGDVVIPDTIDGKPVTAIRYEAFFDCYSLTSITIPNGVTAIGDGAFCGCTSLTNITIPSSVTVIGNEAFSACISLMSIQVEDGNSTYSSIDGVLFNKDDAELILYPSKKEGSSYDVPDGVTSIEDWAFARCESLTSITIPNSVISIGEQAFYECTSLTSITIPDGVTSIGEGAFQYGFSLTGIQVGEENSAYSSIDGVLFNKDATELIVLPAGKKNSSYDIPDSVTSIGSRAFSCASLTSITIPDSVTSIGDYTFYFCTSLASITIPDGVTGIGDGAFYSCNSLTSITIPNSVTSIGDGAFNNCDQLTIYGSKGSYAQQYAEENGIPFMTSDDPSTGDDPATDDDAFTYTVLDDDTVEITGYTGEGGDVVIPDMIEGKPVTAIGYEAFSDCYSLTSVAIPNSVINIGSRAFLGCISLTNITIPDSVTSIGNWAFHYCSSLTGIQVGEENGAYVSIDGVLFNRDVTELIRFPVGKEAGSYDIPDSVTGIGDGAFFDCTSLASVTIPDNVTSIGNGAFSWCESLMSVEVPNGVTFIGELAFADCFSLTSITIPDSVTSIGEWAFEESDKVTVYGSKDSYAQQYAEENGIPFVAMQLTLTGGDTGVTVTYANGAVFAEGMSLSVKTVADAAVTGYDNAVVLDITLLQNGEEVQPASAVVVRLPVPAGMNGERCRVLRTEPDGTLTDMNAVYQDGMLVFTSEHFSQYAVVEEADSSTGDDPSTAVRGDVNGDSAVNTTDARLVLQYAVGKIDESALDLTVADVNRDGEVNTTDARLILQFAVGKIENFD